MSDLEKIIYTIGYSSFEIGSFIETVKKHHINAIVDVRSSPYSQYKPDFNREILKEALQKNNISYVFLGKECGARVDDKSCYVNGKVDYSLVSKLEIFQNGIQRLIDGASKFSLALLCAEKDPITCHRTILICKNLKNHGVIIMHVLENGKLEAHYDSEKRLLKLFKLHHPDLFRSEQNRLDEAYLRQGEKIAYEPEKQNETN
ncbi:MAG TPA: DUF488 domain-containing protein [Bacteroidales bacterium]|jgi:uncharacterized protein (DUF488 family)|nr:DUF488 domain-containing protein [Bacteroidales bacterium]